MNAKLFKLCKMLLNLASVSTDRGELNYDGALEIGTEVFVANEEGDFVPAADGEYTTEDNTVIVVAEGKVAEIKPAEEVIETPAQEPENDPEHVEEVLEETETEPEQEPESAEPEQDEKDVKIAELEARIAELEAEKAELEAKLEEAASKEAELSAKLKMSAEESAAKRAKKETKLIVKRSQYI